MILTPNGRFELNTKVFISFDRTRFISIFNPRFGRFVLASQIVCLLHYFTLGLA